LKDVAIILLIMLLFYEVTGDWCYWIYL